VETFDDLKNFVFYGDVGGNIYQIDDKSKQSKLLIQTKEEHVSMLGNALQAIQFLKVRQFLFVAGYSSFLVCSLKLVNQTQPLFSVKLNLPARSFHYYNDVFYIWVRAEEDNQIVVWKPDWIKLSKAEELVSASP